MGISGSKSKTKTETNQSNSETTSGTTMPVTPPWLIEAAQDYVGRIAGLGGMDPNSFVAGASPLQQMAWNNVGNLSDWQGQARAASQLARSAGSAPANLATAVPGVKAATGTASTYTTPAISGTKGPTAVAADPVTLGKANIMTGAQVAAPSLAPASLATASGYTAPDLPDAALVSGRGYTAPQLGDAQGYAAARTGAPIEATSQGYTPTAVGSTTIAPVADAAASTAGAASLLDNFSAYQNPYNQQVLSAALADFDQGAAAQQARLAAQGARTGAFGGSRFGIAEGQLAGDIARGRGSLSANLLSQGFDTAAQLAQSDAANRQQSGLFNAQNQTGVSVANAGAANQRALAQAALSQEGNLFNSAQQAEAAKFGAAGANQASLFNAGQAGQFALDQAGRADQAAMFGAQSNNDFDLARAGFQAQAGQFGAAARNAAAMANQQAQNQYGLAQAGLTADASQFTNAARNATSLANAGFRNDNNLQGAQLGLQAGLANQASTNAAGAANMDARNQYGLAQFGANTNAAAQYAAAQNQMGLAGYQGNLQTNLAQAELEAQAASQNAAAQNAMTQANMGALNQIGMFNNSQAHALSQFNAGQHDNAANRGLQGASLLGDLANQYSNNTRGDLQLMSQLGEQQRGIEQQYAMAGPAQLQMMGQLSGMTPYQILVGQAVNGQSAGTMTGTGTSTTTASPSLFNQLLGAAATAASFIPKSDRRAKRDIHAIGRLANGLGLYSYRYLWDGDERRPRIGVMADQVARIAPAALGPIEDGYMTVDYGKLGLAHLVEA